MKCGIIGLTNVGKTTLFNCISESKAEASNFAFSTNKSNLGKISIPDKRLDNLAKLVNSKKIVYNTMEIVDIPGLAKGASKGEGIGNQFLADIQQTDALIHVLRCFDDENLPHIEGSINPVRDKELIDFELQIRDYELVEKKLIRMEKMAKSNDKEAKAAVEVLKKYHTHLEEAPARTLEIDEEDKIHVKDLGLLSSKPVLYVCNVDENSIKEDNAYVKTFKKAIKKENAEVLVIAGQLESEIAELEDPEEQKEFLEDAGLEEPGVNKLIMSAYTLLNLITFFTAGEKESRAWTLRKGKAAPDAAGVIHSDLQRGFIRAEVIKYADYIELGSEKACKDNGKFYTEGKSYIVADGDVLNIRFNV